MIGQRKSTLSSPYLFRFITVENVAYENETIRGTYTDQDIRGIFNIILEVLE